MERSEPRGSHGVLCQCQIERDRSASAGGTPCGEGEHSRSWQSVSNVDGKLARKGRGVILFGPSLDAFITRPASTGPSRSPTGLYSLDNAAGTVHDRKHAYDNAYDHYYPAICPSAQHVSDNYHSP